MMINTNTIVPMTEANQNFSKVARLVDEKGVAVIMKNNKPRYVLIEYNEYDAIGIERKQHIMKTANEIIDRNIDAFKELAK